MPLILLIAVVGLQIIPLGAFADFLSPTAAQWKAELLPEQMEQLASGHAADRPALTARGRISLYPAETLRRFYWCGLMALLFTRVQTLATTATLRRLCYACLVNGSILAYFSVIQHFTSESGKIFWTFQSMGAAFGPFVNRNHFAFYINICFGLSMGLVGSRQLGKFSQFNLDGIIESLKDSAALWMVSVLIFMLGAVVVCSSRGGMISLVGSLLITSTFVAATGTFRRGWKWFVLAAAIFGVAAFVQVWLGFDFAESHYADHTDNRTELWMPLVRLVPQFPIFGTGLGCLPHVEPWTRTTPVADYYLEYAHNEYLQLAIETGLLGLLCGCLFLLLLASKIGKRIRDSRHNAWLYVGLLFCLTSISLHSVTEFGLAIPAIAVLVATVFGHIAGLGRVKSADGDSRLSKPMAGLLAVGVLLFSGFAFRDAKLFDLGERSLLQAQRAHNESRPKDELLHYKNALGFTPNDIEFLLEYGRLKFKHLELAGAAESNHNVSLAQQALIDARELCPMSADAHFLLGRYQSTFQQADDPLAYYSRAMLARPLDSTLAYITGLTYLHADDEPRAIEVFRRALLLDPKHLDQILVRVVGDPDFDSHGMELDEDRIQSLLPIEKPHVILLAADWLEQNAADSGAAVRGKQIADSLRRWALASQAVRSASSGELFHTKAILHLRLNEIPQAIDAFESALRYAPANIHWRLEFAAVLGSVRRYDAAHRHINRVLRKNSAYAPALRLRDQLLDTQSEGD